jgi:hypothetical protein
MRTVQGDNPMMRIVNDNFSSGLIDDPMGGFNPEFVPHCRGDIQAIDHPNRQQPANEFGGLFHRLFLKNDL